MSDIHSALILVPHQDDEINIAGQVIPSMVEAGVECHVCFSTNGDFRGEDGPVRAREALSVARYLGIPRDNVIFLGYPNYNEKQHLYDYPDAVLRSFGHCETYTYVDELQCWSIRQTGKARPLTRASLRADVVDVLDSLLPDIVFCIDFDSHPDHRALSLLFDEAMEDVLRAHLSYSPLVLKKFAYASSWRGPCDYYEFANSVPPSWIPADWPYELENPNYTWAGRNRLQPHVKTLTSGRKGNAVCGAFSLYPSQGAWPHFRSVCNADVVYWVRRTDNLLYGADVSASSGDASAIGGFRRFEVGSVCSDLKNLEFLPVGWMPDGDDVDRTVRILFPQLTKVFFLRIWCSPGHIPRGILRYESDLGVCAQATFSDNASAVLRLDARRPINSVTVDFSDLEGPFSIASIEVLDCEDEDWEPLRTFKRMLEKHDRKAPVPSRFAKAKALLMKIRVAFYYRVQCKFTKDTKWM